jgi:hypothetical protein
VEKLPESSEIISSILENMFSQYLRFGSVSDGAFYNGSKLKWASSGRSLLNHVFGVRFDLDEMDERVAELTAMCRSWRTRVLWDLDSTYLPEELSACAEHHGWTKWGTYPGMALRLQDLTPDVLMPEGLTIAQVTHPEQLEQWLHVAFGRASELQFIEIREIYTELGIGDHLPWTYYLAFRQSLPVAQPRSSPSGSNTGTEISPDTLMVQAKTTVITYITDLNDGNYAAAYDLLSEASQSAHTRADFEQTGKKGMPLYDLKTAKVSVDGETAVV